ncbi:hypothetical protein ACHMWU_04640 [Aeromicrobium sp. UC242_57]
MSKHRASRSARQGRIGALGIALGLTLIAAGAAVGVVPATGRRRPERAGCSSSRRRHRWRRPPWRRPSLLSPLLLR